MEQSFRQKPQFHTALAIIDSIDNIGREQNVMARETWHNAYFIVNKNKQIKKSFF